MASITVDIRYKLVHLAKALGSVRKAAYDCGVSLATAYRWVKRYRETGACDSRPKPGRPLAWRPLACMEARRLFLDEEGIADIVATALGTKGLAPHKVAKHTAIRAALSVGPMVPLTGSPHLILSEANMRKRAAFACWHGCPAHNSAAATVKEWNGAKHADVSLLTGWPGNSPDLNPIENVWSYIDWQVQRRGEGTFEAFKAAVREELANIPKRMLHNLVKSMGKRMKLVIEKGGQRIKYRPFKFHAFFVFEGYFQLFYNIF